LLAIFIRQNGLEGATVQVEIHYISRSESVLWENGPEEFSDQALAGHSDGSGRS
jgi:hypothetical protein